MILRNDTNGKIGDYVLFNKVNKVYVVRGNPLYLRLRYYYKKWYNISRINLYIVICLIKYTMANLNQTII